MSDSDTIDAVLASTLKELLADRIAARHQFNEIPLRVIYFVTDKGASTVPILQSIHQWAGLYHHKNAENSLPQCQTCNYQN